MSASSSVPIRVLLVEDNPADADLVLEALEDPDAHAVAGRGFVVVHVSRLAAALGHLASETADAVLLDLSLPDSQGLGTFQRLREREPELPIVVLSGLADEEAAARAVREGAQDYLVKGEGDHRLLARAIRYAIERRLAEAERAELLRREQAARARADAAEAAVRARDEFLGVAAHELKTPLTSLLGSAQLLARRAEGGRTPDPDGLAGRLRTVEQQARKLGRLVDQLLDLSRLHADRLDLECAETDLAALVENAADLLGAETTGHVLRLRIRARPRVRVDPLRIEQVLANLLSNAVKFSPNGGQIEVELSEGAGTGVRLVVRDHGIGIPAERRDQIFDAYFRPHADEHRSGMGLGLHISRRIVEMHGGTIEAQFPPDGGTRFVVGLPAGD